MIDEYELKKFALLFEEFENTSGWDQPAKLIVYNGVDLFVVVMDAVDLLAALKALPPYPDPEFMGLSSEGWTYPQHVYDEYDTEEGMLKLFELQPPHQHPQRVSMRGVYLCSKEHEVGLARFQETDELAPIHRFDTNPYFDEVRRLVGKT